MKPFLTSGEVAVAITHGYFTHPLPLFDEPSFPRLLTEVEAAGQMPLLPLAVKQCVFVERRETIDVMSCATGAGWTRVETTHVTITAHQRPYCLKCGERRVRVDRLSEAAVQAALVALNRRRLQQQLEQAT